MIEEKSEDDATAAAEKERKDAEGEEEQQSSDVRYFALFFVYAFLIFMGGIFVMAIICAGNLEAMVLRAYDKLRDGLR
jgi:hypothetical protein